MATKKISELPAATTVDGTEVFPVVQGSTTKKVGLSAALTALGIGGGPPVAASSPVTTLFSVAGNARKWSGALASRSTSSPARLVIFGDSVDEGLDALWVNRLKNRLAPYNGGKVDIGWVHGSQDVANVFNAYKFALTTGAANTPSGQNLEQVRSLSTSGWYLASGSVLTLQKWIGPGNTDYSNASVICDRIEFHYVVNGTSGVNGSLEIRVDGVLVQTISGTDTAIGAGKFEGRTYTWSGTRGAHTVTVTGIGGLPTSFGGAYISDGGMLWVYQAGNAGAKVTSFNNAHTDGGRPIQFAKWIDADCILWAHGINDYADGSAPAAANLGLALTRSKDALDDVSLGYILPWATSTRTDWGDFVTAYKAICAANSVPVLDLSTMLKTNASTTDPFDLIQDADAIPNTHPSASGGEYIAEATARFLGLDGIDWAAWRTAVASPLRLPEISTALPSPLVAEPDVVQIASFDDAGNTKTIALLPTGKFQFLASPIKSDLDPWTAEMAGGVASLRETTPRHLCSGTDLNVLTSGQIFMVSIPLRAGETVTNIWFWSGATAAVSPTNWWFGLTTTGRVVQAFTADQLTAAWAANTQKTLALTAPFTAVVSGNYYLLIMMKAATPVSLLGDTRSATLAAATPILNGNSSSTGQTTPPALPFTAGAITAGTGRPFAGIS